MSDSQQLVEISSVPSLPLKQFRPSRNIRIEMLVAASEGLCCHKCPAWGGPWGHPARWEGGTKGLSPVLCPQVSPAVALGSLHALPSIPVLVCKPSFSLFPPNPAQSLAQQAWSDVPDTAPLAITSAFQSSPVLPSSSTGAKHKRGVFQSSFNSLRATGQEEQFF